jgi:ribonuclease BN (tRNA processing enzyme)
MSKIIFLGTCSGTEPMVGMHHSSWILDTGDHIYWFDGGEGCAHTAYTMGVDIMKTRALFVSHPHTDHVGGISHLFFCINKLCSRYSKKLVCDNKLRVFFPDDEIFDAIITLATGGKRKMKFDIDKQATRDGELYADENISVKAIHNRHLNEDGSRGWHSFSFLVENGGKRLVFSGDVKSPMELDEFLEGGADVLIMETGHHKVDDVCRYALSKGVKRLYLTHHGRQILEGRSYWEEFVETFSKENQIDIKLCYDTMIQEL